MASQKIRIKLMSYDVEMLDSVVGAVTDSGMSDIYSVTYDVSNRSDLYKQALELAIDAAANEWRTPAGYRMLKSGQIRTREALIDEYYSIAPGIVSCINVCENRAEKYAAIREKWLEPCYQDLLAGRQASCKARYVEMVRSLEREYLS